MLGACQVVFVKGTLNLPLLSVSRESNSQVSKDVCRQTNSCESVGESSVTDRVKRFLLSASHSSSLSGGL